MRRCLMRGIGVTLCPEIAVEHHLADGRLVKLAWTDPESDTPVLMIWHSEKWRSPLLKAFMDVSQAVIGA